ncbi:MAG: sigma-70 family RNA polymerase sigma factor [Planctomycetes bacterium]|nr:sigma-70 family RNA polymerase sigma factor [Planctomycetota bacterium]
MTESEKVPEITDSEAVARCLGGDVDAFGVLVERYQKRTLWITYQMVQDWDEASDLTQETFTRAFKSLSNFDIEKSFYTWVSRIAVNTSIDFIRKRDRMRIVPDETLVLFPSSDDVPESYVSQGERKRNVYKILDTLPDKYRTILVLKDIEGIPGKEIAEILEIDYQTVRWRIHHARKLFKEQWERTVEKSSSDSE